MEQNVSGGFSGRDQPIGGQFDDAPVASPDMTKEPPAQPEFIPPSPAGTEATNFLANLVAFAIEVSTELKGVGSALSGGLALLRMTQANMQDAGRSFAAVVASNRAAFQKLEDRVKAAEIDRETLHARLTMTQRAIHEAGRHPDKVLREALGAFAARVLLADLDNSEVFQVADCLSRLTALEYDFLGVVHDCYRRGVHPVLKQDGTRDTEEWTVSTLSSGEGGGAPAHVVTDRLRDRYPTLSYERGLVVEQRLTGLGLLLEQDAESIGMKMFSWSSPTGLTLRLLELAQQPPGADAPPKD